jgi:cytolysin-activating lysine-acyltransferase
MDATAAFGAVIWLAMQAPEVKDLMLHRLNQLVLQPPTAGCEMPISIPDAEGKWRPRLWLAYAHLSAEFERDYVRAPSMLVPPQAWHSGDRLWLMHVIAPNGFEQELRRTPQDLFAARSARSLSPIARGLGDGWWLGVGSAARIPTQSSFGGNAPSWLDGETCA